MLVFHVLIFSIPFFYNNIKDNTSFINLGINLIIYLVIIKKFYK